MQSNPSVDPAYDHALLKIVIAYNDATAAKRATHSLTQFNNEMDGEPQLWRFDILEEPHFRAAATIDAIQANIFIISTSHETEFPVTVESWVIACLAHKRGTNAAVIALFGPVENMDGPDSSRLISVQRAAKEAGLDFFAPEPHHGTSLNFIIEDIHRRANAVDSTLDGIFMKPKPRWLPDA